MVSTDLSLLAGAVLHVCQWNHHDQRRQRPCTLHSSLVSVSMCDDRVCVKERIAIDPDLFVCARFMCVSHQRYISTNTCKMSVIGVVPCITYVIAADTGVPLQTINATPRRPNSFENDHYEVMTYSNFQLGPPDESAFELPSNWTVAYRNFNNAVVIERPPGTSSSIVTPTKPLNFTLRLTTVPVQALGPVTLELISAPGINYNCTSCISVCRQYCVV